MTNPRQLTAAELWNACDPASFDFETTESLPRDVIVIGQDRAVQAIDFGIEITGDGYNIYAMGERGTGRTTTIHTFIQRIARGQDCPDDWIYVNNFTDGDRPCAIPLPPGVAVEFRHAMQELVRDLDTELPRAFESAAYERQRDRIVRAVQSQQEARLTQLESEIGRHGFSLARAETGLGLVPVIDGQALTPEAYSELDQETQAQIAEREETAEPLVATALRRIRELEKQMKVKLQDLDRRIATTAVTQLMAELRQKYGHLPEIPDYLDAVQADIVDNAGSFKGGEETVQEAGGASPADRKKALAKRYAVNVLVDHSGQEGAPVVSEPNPTLSNLLGRIEYRAEYGALVTDLTMIRAGALHRANGGYLIIEVRPLLSNLSAWEALKRALKNREIRIEEPGGDQQAMSTVSPQPEPIPLKVKVLLLGDPESYYVLYDLDDEFRKIFKVKAEFGSDFERTPETVGCYAQFIAARCHQEGLLHFAPEAVAMVVEYGSRLAEHQHKLSTRFGDIADLVREASFWARRQLHDRVLAADVQRALDAKLSRSNRTEEEIQKLIEDGTIRVDVDGQAVGQLNGLSVLSLGDHDFGRPSRITVRTYTGKSGVISLDREARLSGRIYDKGVLTLSGYLGGKYALNAALSLSATISFEQLYEEVDGDSASSGELYALLSSLSGLPIDQSIAVTGSVDQQGNIQPVGGINEKVEGFFETCRRRGLTGRQGVIVPAANVVNLMLRADVRKAVEEGSFHVYAIQSTDEGLQILTGVAAGEQEPDGTYPVDSVHGRVMDRLAEIAENLREPKDEDEATDIDGAPYESEIGASSLETRSQSAPPALRLARRRQP